MLEREIPLAVTAQTKLAAFNAFIEKNRTALEAIDKFEGSYTWMGSWVSTASEGCIEDGSGSLECQGRYTLSDDTYVTYYLSNDPNEGGYSIEIHDVAFDYELAFSRSQDYHSSDVTLSDWVSRNSGSSLGRSRRLSLPFGHVEEHSGFEGADLAEFASSVSLPSLRYELVIDKGSAVLTVQGKKRFSGPADRCDPDSFKNVLPSPPEYPFKRPVR